MRIISNQSENLSKRKTSWGFSISTSVLCYLSTLFSAPILASIEDENISPPPIIGFFERSLRNIYNFEFDELEFSET
ncbi:MAG: hypothetical protein KKE11_01700, partial [Gammaproteobacteria bacterium]|nr:hypothetical protein [Gammaproteobacteria bacterium]